MSETKVESPQLETQIVNAVQLLKNGEVTSPMYQKDFVEAYRRDPLWGTALTALTIAERQFALPRQESHYRDNSLSRTREAVGDYADSEIIRDYCEPRSPKGIALRSLKSVTSGSEEDFAQFLQGAEIFLGKYIPALKEKKDSARYNPDRVKGLQSSIGIVLRKRGAA